MLNVIYAIIIFPIVQIIETVYVLVYKVFDSAAFSVIGVSFAVTILCLPLYVIAEKWQKTERDITKKLKPGIDKIKAVFKGDEQYMILSTYYRQNHYHPIYAMRSSFGILIQIPFFLAAYTYLSTLESLRGESFFFIRDLGVPDSIFNIGNFRVNILPIAMTFINCIAGAIYTRGLPARDKIQVYGMAAVFVVLLYNSPSGLVLYWTMNNVFSLIKNIFYRLKNPLRVLYVIISLGVIAFIAYLLFINNGTLRKRLILSGALTLFFFIPLYIRAITYIYRKFLLPLFANTSQRNILFLLSCLILTILTGLFIPSTVISSSPEEFSFIDQYKSPFPFIFSSFSQTIGFFTFWPLCIYFLFNAQIKTILTALFSVTAIFSLVNTVIFQGDYGVITNTFLFNTTGVLDVPVLSVFLNIFCFLVLICFIFLIFRVNKIKIISSIEVILLLSSLFFSGYNMLRINKGYKELLSRRDDTQGAVHSVSPIFHLSEDEPNIIIFFADAAINGYVKPIFEEHPQLKEQFDGFTLYPNTVSFALHTLMGVPPIWGGYEYTPSEMNRHDTVPMVEKHNEALLVLPRLFADEGYEVTVTDPSWANYAWVPDTRIYDKYDHITAFNTKGRYNSVWYLRNNYGNGDITGNHIKRNVLWFSFLKIVPPMIRFLIYDDGWYWSTDDIGYSITDFINSYAVLDFLPELTSYDAEKPSALFISNEVTHELLYLQYPDYIPQQIVTDRGGGVFSNNEYYHINNAFYLRFGEWLDELKKNGVYDNTRIIIVSDHGAGVNPYPELKEIPIPGEGRGKYNPVLLMKDFNEHGELEINMDFMTQADVPTLASAGIIKDPANPFTAKPINTNPKKEGALITTNHISMAYQHNKTTYKIRKNQWIHVQDNIFNEENWRLVEK
ncbi:inner membrane protein [Treponema primitia ZAS-2]|uniref:Inner membrane protein n=1 Tax=Treponema primitia (strain ATCC BAA-887 / DSM 12427 / ZAS-2) TaxID=545694 RepID=F5YHI0_TREPZ|nr:YidC/Oxa1 family membrane protein insertase [Treponema primitia]AEF86880.1 inner membrane protein [Treponema primitia ZAS-2]